MKNKCCFLFILFFPGIFFSAQFLTALSIIPVRVYKNVQLNKMEKGEYTIINTDPIMVKVMIEKTETADWLVLTNKEIILKPNETKKVPYGILVKDPLLKGELKTEITVTEKKLSDQKLPQRGASFQTRLRIPVYAMLQDTETIDYQLMKLDFKGIMQKKDKTLMGRMSVDFSFQNTGNVHFLCESRISVYKLSKENYRTSVGEKIMDQVPIIFPGENKQMQIEYEGTFEPGTYIIRLFSYFQFDENLPVNNIRILKKEKCFNTTQKCIIDEQGNFKLIN